jgi:hypothetical protein
MLQFKPTSRLNTAVLLIIFNRPETTKQVFESIRTAQPSRLYIAADGPRANKQGEFEKCQAAKQIVSNVDWDCEVKTLYREQNLNCGLGPSTAISWFFDHEEEGIILEDDCLPTQSFFWFCQELLERYRDDYRIMHIGGNNFLDGWQRDHDYSYYFSYNGHIWGWATWRRAWKMYDFKLSQYEKLKRRKFFDNFFLNQTEKIYRLRKFDKTLAASRVDWWDYQWDFARYINSGLAIVPENNLVKNIGFGTNSTHTVDSGHKCAKMKATDIEFPLHHPPFTIRDFASDKKYFRGFIKDVVMSKVI